MIKLLIFDIGGVLMQKKGDFENNLKLVAEKYGSTKEESLKAFYKNFEEYHNKRILSQYQFWKLFLKELGKEMNDDDFKYLFDIFNDVSQEKENDKLTDLVKNLSKKGYKLAILSHSFRDMDLQIYNSKFLRYFDRICLSHMNSKKKDTRESFMEIMDAFDVEPEEVLFIEDKEKNIVAPRGLGINTFLYSLDVHDKFVEKLEELGIDYS